MGGFLSFDFHQTYPRTMVMFRVSGFVVAAMAMRASRAVLKLARSRAWQHDGLEGSSTHVAIATATSTTATLYIPPATSRQHRVSSSNPHVTHNSKLTSQSNRRLFNCHREDYGNADSTTGPAVSRCHHRDTQDQPLVNACSM